MTPTEETELKTLGYSPFFEDARNKLGLTGFQIARVTSEHKESYRVKSTHGEFIAKITGKQMFRAGSREDYPVVGDWVAITELGSDQATINAILPRQTLIKRKFGDKNKFGEKDKIQIIATNIDVAFVVESMDRDYSPNRFERYFSIAKEGGVQPVIILNKVDLLPEDELAEKVAELAKRFPGIDIVTTSVLRDKNLDTLKKYIAKGKTYCFLGSSGVGKSSLINKLLGKDTIKTGEISTYSNRGKQTTTLRQMFFLNSGGIVIDNPGVREVGMTDTDKGIDTVFDEIVMIAKDCKYDDCTHTHEPECAVMDAVKSGKLDGGQYGNYINLKKEAEYFETGGVNKRAKRKTIGKMRKQIKNIRNLGE